MDTRSVMRSRRRSTRLTGQPHQDERVKRPTLGKRHDSDHDMSTRTSSDASHEGSCSQIGSISRASSSHDAHLAPPDTTGTDGVVKDEDMGIVLPLFPNLRPKVKHTQNSRPEADSATAPPKESVDTASEKAVKDHASTKWVKTARGSVRLASESLAGSTKNDTGTDKERDATEERQHASSATARRQCRRLASMTPDIKDEAIEVESIASRPIASKIKVVATMACATGAEGSDADLESTPDLRDHVTRAISAQDPNSCLDHHDELAIHGGKADPINLDPGIQNTSPIPELVADIEKIVQSSPIASRNLADDGTQDTMSSTRAEPLKKRAPANVMTSSSKLFGSACLVDNTLDTAKHLGSEQTGSESSQLDGAFDDNIRSRSKKEAHATHGTVGQSGISGPRGTKRGAKELPQGEEENADASRLRRRRKTDNNHLKPEVSLNSADPIETATSRDTFSAKDPSVKSPHSIGDFAQRNAETLNPVMLAQMISKNPERADSAAHPSPANDGSQGASQIQKSQAQSLEVDSEKCAECGRAPERYLICAKCQETIYCGKYCQLWDWPLHRSRCHASDEADEAEVKLQEKYLKNTWEAALGMLKEEKMADGTVESLLLGEAVRHSPARPAFMGRGSPRGFVGFDVGAASHSTPRDPQSVARTRAMSLRLAQAALGSDE